MEPVAPLPAALDLSRVCVVIPAWNEAEVIGAVVVEALAQGVGEVVLADGGSTDGTQAAAWAAGAQVLDAGRGCAAGAAAVRPGCDVIAFMDGDGADCGDQLPRLAQPVMNGAQDFVIASRTRGNRTPGSMSWHQVAAGAVAGRLIGALYGVRYTDMCAFRVINRDALNRLGMAEMTYGWNIEMQMKAARHGLRILELRVPYRCRVGGQSKVAGSLRGTLRASGKIVSTFARVAVAGTDRSP